jgi:hypothetical protein
VNLEQRVERLERQNFKLKLAVFVTGALLGCPYLMGADQPGQKQADRVTAKEFVLVDDQGKERGALRLVEKKVGTVIHKGPFLILTDSSGTQRYDVGVVEGNNGTNSVRFEMKDKTGKMQVGADAMSEANFQASLFLRHEEGAGIDLTTLSGGAEVEVVGKRTLAAPGVKLAATPDARYLGIFDVRNVQEGVVKTVQEITLIHDKDGNKLTVFDKDGNPVFTKP